MNAKKRCTGCGKVKKLTEFYRTKQLKSGYYSQCKACHKTRVTGWASRNKTAVSTYFKQWLKSRPGYASKKARKYRLKKKYGLTEEQYTELFVTQDGRCKICNKKAKAPHVDHCHVTGKIRGLLCVGCNLGLGQFQDNIERLESAARYLREAAR